MRRVLAERGQVEQTNDNDGIGPGLNSLCGATTMTIDIDLKDATTGLCVPASLLVAASAGLGSMR